METTVHVATWISNLIGHALISARVETKALAARRTILLATILPAIPMLVVGTLIILIEGLAAVIRAAPEITDTAGVPVIFASLAEGIEMLARSADGIKILTLIAVGIVSGADWAKIFIEHAAIAENIIMSVQRTAGHAKLYAAAKEIIEVLIRSASNHRRRRRISDTRASFVIVVSAIGALIALRLDTVA